MDTLLAIRTVQLDLELQAKVDEAREFMQESRSAATRDAYAADWEQWERWCQQSGYRPLPADTPAVVFYIVELAKRYAASSIHRKVAAISAAHADAELDTPTDEKAVRKALKAARCKSGPQRRVKPLMLDHLQRILPTLPDTLRGKRDRLMLSLGFWTASRSAELVGFSLSDVVDHGDSLEINLARSKTDQGGKGDTKVIFAKPGLPTCPVTAYREWIVASGITGGPLLRPVRGRSILDRQLHKSAVWRLVKRCVESLGLDPDEYASHSIRAGFITTAKDQGVPDSWIITSTGHKSSSMLPRYNRQADKRKQNATRVMAG